MSHPDCQLHCFSGPLCGSLQALVWLGGWQGIRTVTGVSDSEQRQESRETDNGVGDLKLVTQQLEIHLTLSYGGPVNKSGQSV